MYGVALMCVGTRKVMVWVGVVRGVLGWMSE